MKKRQMMETLALIQALRVPFVQAARARQEVVSRAVEWLAAHPEGGEDSGDNIAPSTDHFVCLVCAARTAELDLSEACATDQHEWLLAGKHYSGMASR